MQNRPVEAVIRERQRWPVSGPCWSSVDAAIYRTADDTNAAIPRPRDKGTPTRLRSLSTLFQRDGENVTSNVVACEFLWLLSSL
jgi:hypothetical protein